MKYKVNWDLLGTPIFKELKEKEISLNYFIHKEKEECKCKPAFRLGRQCSFKDKNFAL